MSDDPTGPIRNLAGEDHSVPLRKGKGNVIRRAPWSFLARHFQVIGPCALLVLYASPLVFFQIPNNFDTLTESYEPIKTLKFVHSKGRAFHKWGPMSNFIYAPVYAVPMIYWYCHGDLGNVSTDYPYGFKRPFEQQGDLIVAGRITGLVIAVVCVVLYGRSLMELTGSRLAVFLALTLCVATSPGLIIAFVSTKPDGLMIAFLTASMAVYVDILGKGLTKRRGFFLSLLAVCSISCKELTSLMFVFLYVALAVKGLTNPGENPGARRRFLVAYIFTVGVGFIAYLLINVIYAPQTWRLRMLEWIWGPGKDPAVWAPPGYTLKQYLFDAVAGTLFNLWIGGAAIVVIAMAITLFSSAKDRLMLWIPSIGFAFLVLLTAGYMPAYFLIPLNIAVVLPVAASLAFAERTWFPKIPLVARGTAFGFIAMLCLINMWVANIAWVMPYLSGNALIENYCLRNLKQQELIHTANMWVRQPGASRLTYLGFNVDDRPLGELMARPERMPEVILVDENHAVWIEQFKQREARDAMMLSSGFSYGEFPGFEALGYRVVEIVSAQLPRLFDLPGIRRIFGPVNSRILVYRRNVS